MDHNFLPKKKTENLSTHQNFEFLKVFKKNNIRIGATVPGIRTSNMKNDHNFVNLGIWKAHRDPSQTILYRDSAAYYFPEYACY